MYSIIKTFGRISEGVSHQAEKFIDQIVDEIVGPMDSIELLFTKDF